MNEQLLNKKTEIRKKAIKLYEETGNFYEVAKKFGVHNSTVCRWVERHREEGSFSPKSTRPGHFPLQKITPEVEGLILQMNRQFKIGQTHIARKLAQEHNISLAAPTIGKYLKRHNVGFKKKEIK